MVEAAVHDQDLLPADAADHHFALMPRHRRDRKAGNVPVGDFHGVLSAVGKSAQAAAEGHGTGAVLRIWTEKIGRRRDAFQISHIHTSFRKYAFGPGH